MNKFKKDDEVLIISGKDKGKKGKVKSVKSKTQKVIVENINIIKKHVKPTQDKEGGIVSIEAPIHWSNVKLVESGQKKATRVGFKIVKDKKVRVAKASGNTLK